MNKAKKIAVAAVSFVMAGTMVSSLAACNNGREFKPDDTIEELHYTEGTAVKTAIGYKDEYTAIKFSAANLPLIQADGSATGTSMTLPDGKTYQKGALKPIWNSYQDALKITIDDRWPQSSTTMDDCVKRGLENFDIIGAGSLQDIQGQIDAGTLLNLTPYINYLPNLRHFLDQNTLAELGTLANTQTGAIYYTPYYAGMNDAERFNLFRTDYVSELLDYATDFTKNGGTVTFKYQADRKKNLPLGGRESEEVYDGTKGSIEAYMGQTGSWTVKTTDPSNSLNTVFVKVDYDAALKDAKDTTTALGKAISDAAGKTYDGTSGNIVDLQNFVINAKGGEVAGEHLLKVLRAYIDVAYKWADTENASSWTQFYNTTVKGVKTTRGDVFISNYAAWDVDLYAAIGRCYVTCGNVLGKYQAQTSEYTNQGGSTWLLTTRTGKLDRLTRQTAMIGELYGVRGMESMTYLDSSGTLRQARFNVATWDAFQKFSAFHTEGLVPSFYEASKANNAANGSAGNQSTYRDNAAFQALSSNDFIHTQAVKTVPTDAEEAKKFGETHDGYKWTGVATPVSRWLTNDTSKVAADMAVTPDFNGKLSERPANKTTVMRFTESALKLKGGGLVVPKAVESDQNRLHATLALLDYIYSNDGQIVTTFGDRSDTDNLSGSAANGYTTTNNGWWYGKEVTKLTIDGKETDISGKSMDELYSMGIVETYDNKKQYVISDAYKSQALVYKNKLYQTGTDGGDYDNGYVYQGSMTPYYTRAVHALCHGSAVNGYKINQVDGKPADSYSSTNLQNLLLGAESHGIINNAGMVQLCLPMAIDGFSIISATLGNGSAQTVQQNITENPWYTCAPNVTLDESSSNIINGYTDFTTLFKTDKTLCNYLFTEVAWYGKAASLASFKLSATTTNGANLTTPEGVATFVKNSASMYEALYNATWSDYFDYYTNKNNK